MVLLDSGWVGLIWDSLRWVGVACIGLTFFDMPGFPDHSQPAGPA